MTDNRKVTVHAKRRVFDGLFKIDEAQVSHSRLNGPGMIENTPRLVFERGDSAAAIVHDVERDVIVLTEQFRYPTYEKSPGWMVELVAGSIEPGETAEACIRRETLEELGYRAGAAELISRFYVSPGGTSERILLYYLPVTAADLVNPNANGVASQQEDVLRVEMPTAEFIARCVSGEMQDAKTLIGGLWLKAKLGR